MIYAYILLVGILIGLISGIMLETSKREKLMQQAFEDGSYCLNCEVYDALQAQIDKLEQDNEYLRSVNERRKYGEKSVGTEADECSCLNAAE